MKKILYLLIIVVLTACTAPEKTKIPCYGWVGGPGDQTNEEISEYFTDLKNKGIDGLMYSGGHNPSTYARVGKIAKEVGLEFHTWIPTMVQHTNPKLKPEWYAVNGLGESAFDKPVYVDHYQFLCPNREEVYEFLADLYGLVADVPEVDAVHLDFIRYPDVILARGLWEKYGLVMDKEYPKYDYCYCDKCVADFQEQTGVNILEVEDPSQNEAWRQFRYDLITNMVNRLAEVAHSKNKQINAAVFPGPFSHAKQIARQEWEKWNLDAVYPMNYNDFYLEGTEWIGNMCKEGTEAINHSIPFYSGLFICPKPENKASEPDPENHGLLPEELEDAIRQSMQNGATGICLFTPDRMTDAHWQVFEKAIYTDYTQEGNIQP